jgi:hypothetical protein
MSVEFAFHASLLRNDELLPALDHLLLRTTKGGAVGVATPECEAKVYDEKADTLWPILAKRCLRHYEEKLSGRLLLSIGKIDSALTHHPSKKAALRRVCLLFFFMRGCTQ